MSEKYFQLDDIVLIGRTFAEYHSLFALDNTNADDVILDAAGGVSSFCAEANAQGWNVTAADRVYTLDADTIAAKCAADLQQVMAKLPPVADKYVWKTIPDIPTLTAEREQAYTTFVADYRTHGLQRYVPTTLPQSDFADDQFTLALVSHFLFLYDDHLDYSFHKATLTELLRVTSREVRIFPLVNLHYQRSPIVQRLMTDPDFAHCTFEIVPVDYEFLKGGNKLLRISHNSS
jgi:hypothetical protein